MNRVIRVVSFFCFAFLVIPVSRGDDKKPQEIKNWGTVVDPAGDCKVTEKDGKVTITVPKTHHDLNPTPNFNNVLAPRVLQVVEGDFTVEVKVDAFPRPEARTASSDAGISFVAAGLVVWQDEKNFVRLLRAANGDRGDLFGHLEVYRDGKFVGDGYARNIEEKATYLKLTREGDAFTFAVSADGKEWAEVKGRGNSIGEIDLPKKVKVGVAATNATTKEFAPVFEGFSLKNK